VSPISVRGIGAVSPAGWGLASLRDAVSKEQPLPIRELPRPGRNQPLRVRRVPPPSSPTAFMKHPRLRRTSPVTQYAVAAALEALGDEAAHVATGDLRLGIVLCVMTGCVNYSRRFYDETLKDPATASPLVFPETVFNAPSSHLAALLGTPAINYTLVGDPGVYLHGLALASDWLGSGRVNRCLVVGAEELDWLTADAQRLFSRQVVPAEGAGALCLRSDGKDDPVRLAAITDAQVYSGSLKPDEAARRMRSALPPAQVDHLLCDGLQGVPRVDAAERAAWEDWPGDRLSPRRILGDGLAAAAAWQCVLAVDALLQGRCLGASVSVVGCNEQAIGAHFAGSPK
jgi:3-oxoacyl-(acyl-carrier-protein) synthase